MVFGHIKSEFLLILEIQLGLTVWLGPTATSIKNKSSSIPLKDKSFEKSFVFDGWAWRQKCSMKLLLVYHSPMQNELMFKQNKCPRFQTIYFYVYLGLGAVLFFFSGRNSVDCFFSINFWEDLKNPFNPTAR